MWLMLFKQVAVSAFNGRSVYIMFPMEARAEAKTKVASCRPHFPKLKSAWEGNVH